MIDDSARTAKFFGPRPGGNGIRALVLLCLVFKASALQAGWEEMLQKVDDSLHVATPDGFFRSDLSGLFDLEGYYIDRRPPGLIFGGDDDFINPRLSLFLDTRLGKHLYSFVEGRIDRGFDPRSKPRDARLDQYLLRYSPFEESSLNLQVGKFATVVGNWTARCYSWDNPLINAPLPYENVTTVADQRAPSSVTAFLARRNRPDNKNLWVPLIWGPDYTSGAALLGTLDRVDYAVEVKNASLSSRPQEWDATRVGWEDPTVSARLGCRPDPAWSLGASISSGPYLQTEAAKANAVSAGPYGQPATYQTGLPPGKGIGDYQQQLLAQDVSFAWHHWQLWAESFFNRFQVPNVGNADSFAYYLEAKYKFNDRFFGAFRWNQELFGTVTDASGHQTPWDSAVRRIDLALGCRLNRHLQAKLQYSFTHQDSSLQPGEQLVAAQVTFKF